MPRDRAPNVHDEIVDRLDAVRLAIKGAERLALEAEFADKPTLIAIEIVAILRFTAEALDRIVRELDPSRDA